jgi:tetratricopeptide (TPR) repeat protein
MARPTIFICENCQESFEYRPAPKTERQIEEMEFRAGRAFLVFIECPHCPSSMLIDRETGRVETVADAPPNPDVGGVVWDMTFTEVGKEEVSRLNEEGHRMMPTDPAGAGKLFREAAAIRKHDPMTHYNLGVSLYSTGDTSGAESSFRHALRFDPTLTPGWNNLGSMLVELGRLDEADACFDRGIALDPSYPKCYFGKSNAALLRGDLPGSRRLLRQALEKDPSYAPAHAALARLDELEASEPGEVLAGRLLDAVRRRSKS